MFEGPLTESLIKKALEKKILEINLVNIRSFTTDKHHSVDDRSFGGGPGMVLKVEPVYSALKSLGAVGNKKAYSTNKRGKTPVIYLSPQGKPLGQKLIKKLAKFKRLILLCGHYEGVDERALNFVDMEVSIGDYVLTGGELPAMVLIDAISRFLPGVVKERSSVEQDSFFNGLLDYPHYTRPEKFLDMSIPEVLLSGHHAKIEEWRKKQAIKATLEKRPDLLKKIKYQN